MDIISRKTAKEKELKHYFTGKPCSEGGIGLRLVSNGRCYCDLSTKCSKTPSFRAGSRQKLKVVLLIHIVYNPVKIIDNTMWK